MCDKFEGRLIPAEVPDMHNYLKWEPFGVCGLILPWNSSIGGFKQSGYGRENGFEGMRCFMQTKSVWLATDPKQADPFPA